MWKGKTMSRKCRRLVEQHTVNLTVPNGSYWTARHIAATRFPHPNEADIWNLINAFADLADGYAAQTSGERLLGQDGYFAEHAENMVKAMRAYLNFDVGRFDCGTLDRLICDLAKAAGVELED